MIEVNATHLVNLARGLEGERTREPASFRGALKSRLASTLALQERETLRDRAA